MNVQLGELIFTGMFVLIAATDSSSELCDPWERNEILDAIITPDKTLLDPLNVVIYPNGTYWKDDKSMSYYGCPCMLGKPCIRKCCQMNEAMDYDTHHCVTHEVPLPWFQPNVPSDGNYNFRVEDVNYFGVIVGKYCHGYPLGPLIYVDKFFINFTDGTLAMPEQKRYGLGVEWYCLEYIPQIHTYLPYVCSEHLGIKSYTPDPCHEWVITVKPIGMSISVFFLLISLMVLLLLPDMRDMHGKCLMCLIMSFICAFMCEMVHEFIVHQLSRRVCVTNEILSYFSALCIFFWLNIMFIDICVAFSSIKPLQGSVKPGVPKKFILYVYYAFGLPFIITAIAIIIDVYTGIPSKVIKPGFTTTSYCRFNDAASWYAYYVIPGVVVLGNVVAFVVTAFNIWKREKETSMVHAGYNGRHDNKEDKNRFKLYTILSVVMGLSLIMKIIFENVGGSLCYWMPLILFYDLQGVFLFVLFICRDKVKTLLIKEYGDKWPIIKKLSGCRRSETSASTSISNLFSTATNIEMTEITPGPASSSVSDAV